MNLIRICFIFLCLPAFANPLFDRPKIVRLLPGLVAPLAVKPAIPDDFDVASPDGSPEVGDMLFWGNPGVLQGYFNDPASLREPVIGVQVSMNLKQKGSKEFSGEKEMLREMKAHGFKVVKSRKLTWSIYPVWVVQLLTPDNKVRHLAWVGLNAPHGSVLMFHLIYPSWWSQKKAQTVSLWENFLTKTELLSDKEFFKANGMALSEGSTLVDDAGVKMEVTAERRNSDHKLLVVVKPLDSTTEFNLGEIRVGKIGGHVLRGKLIAKVEGQVMHWEKGVRHVNPTHETTVLIKDVDNYSVNLKEVEKNHRIRVYFQ